MNSSPSGTLKTRESAARFGGAELPPPVGSRPVTRDTVRENIGSIVVALVTRTVRQLPTEVVLGRRQGFPVPCVANLDNILTVPRGRLTRLMGACDANKLEELNQVIKAALDVH
jgi:mRNA interferase MazF